MVLAVIRQAAETAPFPDGLFPGCPPWLVVLGGAVLAAALLWLFGKLLKWAIWIIIILVLVGGLFTAGRMLLGV